MRRERLLFMVKIRPEFYVNLRGKMYPTWPGVLVALHENGLLGIEVTPLQHPTEENGGTAICQATVTMKGEDGRELVFTEVGDASPRNCSPMIALAALRMAATRAKGRAGRDALACGETLREELPDDDEASHNGHQRPAQSPRAKHDPQDHAERKAAQEAAEDAPQPMCFQCGQQVPAPVAAASQARWGVVLCVKDGKERAKEEATPPAQLQGA